jgi:uncharacterized protein
MNTPFGLSTMTLEKIHSVFRMYPNVEKAVIYGSRAKGTYKEGSDIDITLCGPALTIQDLYAMINAIDDLLLPYTFDLSIYHNLDDSGLIEHIDRAGKVLYTRDTHL